MLKIPNKEKPMMLWWRKEKEKDVEPVVQSTAINNATN
jgi:hypothetical protein